MQRWLITLDAWLRAAWSWFRQTRRPRRYAVQLLRRGLCARCGAARSCLSFSGITLPSDSYSRARAPTISLTLSSHSQPYGPERASSPLTPTTYVPCWSRWTLRYRYSPREPSRRFAVAVTARLPTAALGAPGGSRPGREGADEVACLRLLVASTPREDCPCALP